MIHMTEDLKAQLGQLPTEERAELAHYLIDTLDDQIDADAEEAWDAELARREADIRHGTVKGEQAGNVFKRLHDRFS